MKEFLIEGEVLSKHGRSVWIGRGGVSSAVAISLGAISRGNKASETINRYMITSLHLLLCDVTRLGGPFYSQPDIKG